MREVKRSSNYLRVLVGPNNDYVWRVSIGEDGQLNVLYIGFAPIDTERELRYPDLSKAPIWMQDRVAVLRMLAEDSETSLIIGLGRRVNYSVFWVVQPMETLGGNDTRSESEA